MPASFRLGPQTEDLLERLARTRAVSKSQIVREAVAAYGQHLEAAEAGSTLHERLKSSLGKFPTGGLDLSVDAGAKVAALLHAEHEAEQVVRTRVGPSSPLAARRTRKSR